MNPNKDGDVKSHNISLEEKIYQNQQRMDSIAQKSFILRNLQPNEDDPRESELFKRLAKAKELAEESKIISQRSFSDSQFWWVAMKRNYDLVGWLLLDVTANMGLYWLDTIKTRTQAKNKFRDISYYTRNQAEKVSMYKGLNYRMMYICAGDIIRNFTNKLNQAILLNPNSAYYNHIYLNKVIIQSFMQESLISVLLLPLEIKKMQTQMGSYRLGMSNLMHSYIRCLAPAVLRDSVFYLNHTLTFNLMMYGSLYSHALIHENAFTPPLIKHNQAHKEKIFNCMMFSIFTSILITNPLDVVITKVATQRSNEYTNPIQAITSIAKEEGIGKLLMGGVSSRLGFYLLKGMLFFHYQQRVMELSNEAFNA